MILIQSCRVRKKLGWVQRDGRVIEGHRSNLSNRPFANEFKDFGRSEIFDEARFLPVSYFLAIVLHFSDLNFMPKAPVANHIPSLENDGGRRRGL